MRHLPIGVALPIAPRAIGSLIQKPNMEEAMQGSRIILVLVEVSIFFVAGIVLTNFVDPRRYIVLWPMIFVLVVLMDFYALKKIRARQAAREKGHLGL